MTESILFSEGARQLRLRHTPIERTDYTGSFRRNSLLTAHLTGKISRNKENKIVETSKRKLQIQMHKLRVHEELDVFMQDKISFISFLI